MRSSVRVLFLAPNAELHFFFFFDGARVLLLAAGYRHVLVRVCMLAVGTGGEAEEGGGSSGGAAHGDELQGHEAQGSGSPGRAAGRLQVEEGEVRLTFFRDVSDV